MVSTNTYFVVSGVNSSCFLYTLSFLRLDRCSKTPILEVVEHAWAAVFLDHRNARSATVLARSFVPHTLVVHRNAQSDTVLSRSSIPHTLVHSKSFCALDLGQPLFSYTGTLDLLPSCPVPPYLTLSLSLSPSISLSLSLSLSFSR